MFIHCSALDTDNFFIVAVDDRSTNVIYHVEYATGTTTQLIQHDDWAHPFAVAYDPATKFAYWSDLEYNAINRYSLISRNRSTIYSDSQSSVILRGVFSSV